MAQKKPYHYLDSPDGEDIFKKLWYVMKPTTLAAGFVGLSDILLYSHPKGYVPTLSRLAYMGTPILAAGATFVLTVNSLASIRKKDDKLNWFLGGFATGTIFGAWTRNKMLGFNLGMFLGFVAFLNKMGIENKFDIIPKRQRIIYDVNRIDWTLFKDRPGNWTTGK